VAKPLVRIAPLGLADKSDFLASACASRPAGHAGPLMQCAGILAGRRCAAPSKPMKLPQALLVKLSPLVEAVRGEPLVAPFLRIHVHGGQGLELTSSYGHFWFDSERRLVFRDDQQVSTFEAIASIDLAGFPGGRGAPSWSVSLYRSPVDRITVARSYDDGEASVLGARLARLMDCKVVSLVGRPR
jgi:hypothetical protein